MLRTPYLPFHILSDLSASLAAPTADASARPAALTGDRASIRERLRALVDRPAVRDAIHVASPDLSRSIPVWLESPDSDRGTAVERALYRYVTRMAARPTPFGLFAGTGVGPIGADTRLSLAPQSAARRHTRLDMDYLARLIDVLARDPRLAPTLRFEPNNSLHQIAGRWHYVETHLVNDTRMHRLVAVDDTDALAVTLARAADGAPRAALAAALADDEITETEALSYIDELIASQILVADLECAVTGPEPLPRLLEAIEAYPAARESASTLAAVASELDRIDAEGVGVAPERYEAIGERLRGFDVKIEAARLLQVDLIRPGLDASLGEDVVREIAAGVDVLRRVCPVTLDERLARLREAFVERYERREVPLADMLDEEAGIGSALSGGRDRDASALLQDLHFPDPPSTTAPWSHRESGLLERVGRVLIDGRHELALTPLDVDELAVKEPPPLPSAFAAIATLCGDPSTRHRVILLHGVSGPSGATLLGRFCHPDPSMLDAVRAHLAAEEALDPDAIHAEIVHLPEGRTGNILLRPSLRSHEIVYLGRSGLPRERQIPVSDLLVSLAGDRFVLRSRRLNRRIVPRLTSAHNFTRHAVGVYRFLCLLQADGCTPAAAWQWGALESLPFLPRVTLGRLVLSRARWRLTVNEIRQLTAARGAARYEAVQAWRARRGVPRWIVLADYDNTLVVDLDNVVAVDSLVQLLHDRREAHLSELLPGPDELMASGPEGRFVHEVVIPFTADRLPSTVTRPPSTVHRPPSTVHRPPSTVYPPPSTVNRPPSTVNRPPSTVNRPPSTVNRPPSTERHAFPGSEWVYVKLYAGHATADRLLRDVIGPVSRRLVHRGTVSRWFFIRYADPQPHVRWRLRISSPARLGTVRRAAERAAAGLLETTIIERFVYDTYHREIERYGGADGLDVAESWFHVDSDTALDLIAAATGSGATADTRWQAALISVDRLLGDLELDLPRRLRVIRRAREEWGERVHADADVGRQLAKRYRGVRAELARLLAGTVAPDGALATVLEILDRRSMSTRPLVERLRRLEADGQLTEPIDGLADSYVHMHVNRLIRAEQNLHEVVLYDFLVQLYTEQLARGRAAAAQQGR